MIWITTDTPLAGGGRGSRRRRRIFVWVARLWPRIEARDYDFLQGEDHIVMAVDTGTFRRRASSLLITSA